MISGANPFPAPIITKPFFPSLLLQRGKKNLIPESHHAAPFGWVLELILD